MRIAKLLFLCFLWSLSFCTLQKKEENIAEYSINFGKTENSENGGSLAINFISEEKLDYENFELKIAEKFPETEYEINWVSASPLPPIPLGKKPMKPTIHRPMFNNTFSNIKRNREIHINLSSGEYYAVLESNNKVLGRIYLFQFGFTSERIQFTPKYQLIKKYEGNCLNETTDVYLHFGSCSKVKIIAGKKTFINVFIPKSIPLTITERIRIWGPFAILYFNEYDAVYREMRVELINPEEQKNEVIE